MKNERSRITNGYGNVFYCLNVSVGQVGVV
jgi:hypothetical protein